MSNLISEKSRLFFKNFVNRLSVSRVPYWYKSVRMDKYSHPLVFPPNSRPSSAWLIDLFFYFRLSLVFLFGQFAASAWADVAVLANRTVSTITVEIIRSGELPKNLTISSGDSQPVLFQRSLQIRFGKGLQQQQYPLQAGNAFFFTRGADGETLRLEQIGLGEQPLPHVIQDFGGVQSLGPRVQRKNKDSSLRSSPLQALDSAATITVKILVDDNEPAHRKIWEPKLRQRVAKASKILERHSGVRFQVVEVATWDSEEKQRNFLQTLREFEREIKTQPAQLAIGFSSQYRAVRGRSHLGVTRWPMHSHILLREHSRDLLESEKLELLVHELGHYLGASHSPEPQSVMRPLLTRGQQRGVGSHIQFDPVNALIIAMVGEELRLHGVRDFRSLSKPTVERLKQIYGVLKKALPHDPAARQYLRILDLGSAPKLLANTASQPAAPLVLDTSKVLTHLLKVAKERPARAQEESSKDGDSGLSGDELTNLYVRQAALVAAQLRSSSAKRAMLLALGIFMDDTLTLRSTPGIGDFIRRVESEQQRRVRTESMGKPTMRERTDLTKHFFVSAHLVVASNKRATISAGLAKEMMDSQRGTGFSFVDMAANRAGVVFAEHVLSGALPLTDLARDFHIDDYLPSLRGLQEGLSLVNLQKNYGGDGQTTLAEELEQIEQRVLSLPAYDRADK